jgi:hypothetical protein
MVKTPRIETLPGMGISKPKCEVRSLTTLERWEREGYCKTLVDAVSNLTVFASMARSLGC